MIVTMPDGIDVEFPDDMPREKIKGIIEKKYPKEVGEFKGIDVSKLDVNNVMSDDGLNSQPSSKIDTMLSVAKFLTPKDSELGWFVRMADLGVRTIENTEFSKLGTEAGKSAGRALNTAVVGGTGFLIKMAGDMFYPEYNAKDYEADTVFTRVKKFKDDSNRAVFGAIRDFGQSVQDFSERVNTSEYLKADEKLFAGDWEQNPNLHKVTDLAMSGATSVVGAYVMSSVAGPAAGLMLFSGIDAKDLYEEAREKGVSKGKAFGIWLAGTAGTAYIEKFGVESAFGVKIGRGGMTKIVNSAKSTTSKITDAMLANAGEEYLQTVWQNTVAKVGYDGARNIFQNAVESAVGGALGGGLVASFNFGYQAFKSNSQKSGLTQQEQDNVITAVGQAIANNPDMVDVPFQENMKKTYASFQQMIKELGDTPEAERLKETKRQLDEVYSKTFEQLKDKMPEKQAKAVSDIARSSALFFSDLEGMSVGEWFEKNAPQIKKVDSIENEIRQFAKNIEPIKTRLDLEDINLFEALKNPDIVKRYREKDTRSSLLQFIKKRGGAVDAGGELKAMDIGKNVIGAINNKSGESLDDLALAAWENGYFPEKTERPTVNELLEAIRDESFGKKRYAEEKQADLEDMVADLSEALDRMNIDYQNMTAQEIEQAYNDYLADMEERSAMNAEYADEASRAEDMFDLSYFQVADENQRLDEMYPAYEGETITINGQEKTVYNSNGDRIAKSKEALENFYKWFGDSKVVDGQGRPLVVYHGTLELFDTFDKERIGDRWNADERGFFFIDKENLAKGYARSDFDESRQGYVMPVYISAKKPLIVDSKTARKYGFDSRVFDREDSISFWDDYGAFLLENYADKNKNDAIIISDGYSRMVVAFEPNQIKSTSNRGTYSESENIYYQEGEYRAEYEQMEALEEELERWRENLEKSKENPYNLPESTVKYNIDFDKRQIARVKKQIKELEDSLKEPLAEKLYATHNMSLAGVKGALKLGGMAMPSLAMRRVSQGNINQFGDIVFVADKNMASPSRKTTVFDRDAWTPSIAMQMKYDLSQKGKDYIRDVLKKHGQGDRATVFFYNINDKLDDPKNNSMALELYALEKGIEFKWEAAESQDYLDWYEKNIEDNAIPYLFTENDANTDMVAKKFTLPNIMKILKKQDASGGGFLGDSVWDLSHTLQFLAKDLRTMKDVRANKDRIVTREKQSEYLDKLNNDFWELAEELKKDGVDYDYGGARQALAVVLVNGKSKVKEHLEAKKLDSSDAAVKKVEKLIEDMENALTDYFEVKPRRVVNFDEFAGVVVPNGKQYDEVAEQLKDRGLRVERVEKGNADQYKDAMMNIYREKPDVFFQSAFAGSRVDYDRPSLEAIGSGEGNQAHGWGLYYALNRAVAERYRKGFVGEFTYQGMKFDNPIERQKILFEQINKQGKDAVLKSYEKQLDDLREQSKKSERMEYALKDSIARLEYDVEWMKDVDEKDLQFGQTHEVDIPENPYLLDEQKPFSEQSDIVKNAIKKLNNEDVNDILDDDTTGEDIYGELVNYFGKQVEGNDLKSKTDNAQKLASQALEKVGIKGITYFGQQDGRCFVIFNPADVKVIQKFYQGEQSPLGAYVNRIIYLSKNANASTLPHELFHFWSDMLRSSKSLRAKEILREVDKWANKEFDRKYSTIKTENGYAVVDKSGKTIYDRMGEGFATEEQARAYAKEELFARGGEKYLSEGKAPSKTLRQAFANFYNWLKKIYVDMMSLDIKLSKPMRDVYATILGGTSIDTFLDSDIDEFIEKRAEAEREKDMEVREIIQQAQGVKPVTLPEKIRKAYEEFDFGETWKKLAIPLSTRAKRVAPTLRNKIRRYEFDVLETKQAYYREIEPMLKKWKEFSKEDSIAFDLALKNGAIDIRDEILRKYNAVEDFKKVTETLEDIYYKANDAGLEVGYIEDYFPRKVTDKDGLLSYLKGTEDWSGFQEALHREDPHGQFSAEEKAEFIDKYLRGVVRADLASYKYSSEKARKLDVIDNVLNQYYADSMQALISYIDGMNARISTVNFFGRNRENVDESIGEFVAYLLNNNEIKPSQVDEVKSILNAVFRRRGVHSKWLRSARDMSYIYTMGGINTAITQLDDIFVAAYKGGVINTISSAFQRDGVTKKDLGIDSIAAEFMTGTGASKVVNWVFKHNGIELIDGFGKNALLNGVLKKMEQMSDADLRKYLEPIMEDETDQTMRDIRNGELSSNVRFFLFNELSDMQPVSLSELPEWYNTGGDGRIFYMLKSFMLKRIDTLRNEIYDKMRSSNKAERIEGWKNMYKLLLLMMIGGATKDLLIDLMYNRYIDLSDTIVNNLLGMVGISKFNIYQAREEGLTNTAAIFVTPPLYQVFQNLAGDVSKYIAGKRELKDFEVFKGLPIIGRFYYWLYGGGKTKTEKKKKKQR